MTSAISVIQKYFSKHVKLLRGISLTMSIFIIFFLGPYLIYSINFMGRIYPNTYLAGINLGGMEPSQAVNILQEKLDSSDKISLIENSKTYIINKTDIGLNYNIQESVLRAYSLTRTENIFADIYKRIELIFKPKYIGLIMSFEESSLSSNIDAVSNRLGDSPLKPYFKIQNGVISLDRGRPGVLIDKKLIRSEIGQSLANNIINEVNIPFKNDDPRLNDSEYQNALNRATKLIGKIITVSYSNNVFNFKDSDLVPILNPKGGYYDDQINLIDKSISSKLNTDPQNPKFAFDGKKVTEFQPATDGLALNVDEFNNQFKKKFIDLENSPGNQMSFIIPVTITKPQVSINEVNNLGIKEKIGEGNSTYYHSIPGRVFNVNLAASRINGNLVKPGETFSFNQTLGDVSKFTGYQQAYIISGGRTVLGDGGGVCQVSTTLFRAVMAAGLPIDERTAHAYRVGYYEQNSPPGLDATVYAPSPDFKFTNNTPGTILIVAKNDPKNYSLIFELYGTSDGRTSSVSKPIVSGVSPPPPDLYQDDPTLPVGTVKQTDFAAWGAKVTFDYAVERNGETIYSKTFVSNYRPWQAIFLRGTKT